MRTYAVLIQADGHAATVPAHLLPNSRPSGAGLNGGADAGVRRLCPFEGAIGEVLGRGTVRASPTRFHIPSNLTVSPAWGLRPHRWPPRLASLLTRDNNGGRQTLEGSTHHTRRKNWGGACKVESVLRKFNSSRSIENCGLHRTLSCQSRGSRLVCAAVALRIAARHPTAAPRSVARRSSATATPAALSGHPSDAAGQRRPLLSPGAVAACAPSPLRTLCGAPRPPGVCCVGPGLAAPSLALFALDLAAGPPASLPPVRAPLGRLLPP